MHLMQSVRYESYSELVSCDHTLNPGAYQMKFINTMPSLRETIRTAQIERPESVPEYIPMHE